VNANGVAWIGRPCRKGMIREYGLQRSNCSRQIATQLRHAIFNPREKRLGAPCFARMEFEIRGAAENVQSGIEFLTENDSVFVMRDVCGAWLGKQYRKRIVADPMVAKKVGGIGGRALHEQVHTERAARTGSWQ